MNTAITMQSHAENYLEERRRLGYRLRSQGNALRSFVRYIDSLSLEGPLTVEIMAAWARRAKTHGDNPATWARRLQLLCPFARYLQQFDPRTEVPDSTTFGYRTQRLAPTFTASRKWSICWQRLAVLTLICVGRPTRDCSACWRQLVCVSLRRCT